MMSKITRIDENGRALKLDDERCRLGVMFGDLTLNWHGLVVPLGPVESVNWRIDPFPHAWRVSFDISDDRTIWFEVDERQAMDVQRLMEDL